MLGVNEVRLLGTLGADPEFRDVNGQPLLTFSIATNELWKDKDDRNQEHTEWHRIALWGRQAERFARVLRKGDVAYVQGSIRSRKYEKNGQMHVAFDIRANRVEALARIQLDTSQTGQAPASPAPPEAEAAPDAIPF